MCCLFVVCVCLLSVSGLAHESVLVNMSGSTFVYTCFASAWGGE